jgi:glycerol kinase
MAEDRHPRLVASTGLDLGGNDVTDATETFVAVLIDLRLLDIKRAFFREGPFGDNHNGRIRPTFMAADERLANLADVEGLFGHQGDRGPAGDPGPGGDVAYVAPHDLNDHYAVVRFGCGVESVDRIRGDLDSRVEAEGAFGAINVVIDCLGHADERNAFLINTSRSRKGSLATDHDERIDLAPSHRGTHSVHTISKHEGLISARSDDCAATRQNAAAIRNRELHASIVEQPTPAVEEAEDLGVEFALGLSNDCTNHGIETRTVTAAGEDTNSHLVTPIEPGSNLPTMGKWMTIQSRFVGIVIAIDAGTTGVRSFAVDESGRPLGVSYREFAQHFPQPGWVEHDANEIWDAVIGTLAELTATYIQPIASIGITNQRETVVLWDKRTGEPRHRAIVWQDRRTAARCEALQNAGHLPLVRETTGLVLDPYFSGTKIEWLLNEGRVETDEHLAFGTVDSWLVWKLTGGAHLTDATNASRTLIYDIRNGCWSEEICSLLGVPMSALPEVQPSSGRFGVTTAGLPIGAGIPVSGIAGDQQASLFGQACFEPGQAKNTYGTGSFVLMNVGTTCPEPVDGLLTTIAWDLDGPNGIETTYAYEGAIFVTGAAIQWLRDGLGLINDAAETGPLAGSVADNGGVVFVPALAGLGSPYWDPRARGTIVGLTRGTGRAEIARATVEAMAFQTRDVVDAMAGASGTGITDLRVDGGASVMDLLLQIQADQLDVPVIRSAVAETTALGAAYLAGLAEGVWDSPAEVVANWAADATFTPASDRSTAEREYTRWQRAVERSRNWDLD